MTKTHLPALLLGTLLAAFGTTTAFGGVCAGTYFQEGPRVVGKTGQNTTSQSGFYVLNDWNGDGRSDFWNFRWNTSTSRQDILIYPALPGGYWNWNAPIIYTTTFGDFATTALFTGFNHSIIDHNSDGIFDMIRNGNGAGGARFTYVYRNNGTSLSAAVQTTWPADNDTQMIPSGFFDLTGDQIVDNIYALVETSTGDYSLKYSAGNADGSFGPPVTILDNTAANELQGSHRVLGDFDGDADIDIAYLSGSGGFQRIRVLKNAGNATFILGDPLTTTPFELPFVGIMDINGDGRTDFLADRGSSFTIFYGQTDATFSESASFPVTNSDAFPFRPVDFNGDGRRDLIFVRNQDYELHFRNVDGTYTRQLFTGRLLSGLDQYAYFEDFNADGKADLFDGNPDTKLFNAFRDEVLFTRTNVCQLATQPSRSMNFNGDGLPDAATWNGTNGQWRYGNAAFTSFASISITSFNWGSSGDVPAPGDFDGDGKTDLTVYRNSEGNWYTLLSGTGAWSVFPFGLPGDIPIPNDYNGGGKTDYAVFRPSEGNWYIWYTETQQFLALHWGSNGDRPVPADYDGDGKYDVAVFRPSEGNWYYIRSSDSGFGIFHWGSDGDVPVPGDYDGDRKADLAVYRTGTWYILRSTNGVFVPVFWGTTGDIPIPVAQRGDIAYPVVVRPGNSRWYNSQYPIGYAFALSGTPIYYGLPNN